jgi:Fic family protein
MNWKCPELGEQNWLSILERVEAKKRRLDSFRPMSASVVARLGEELSLEWTYHSNGIEGNTLTLQETKVVLSDGMTVGGKSLREHFEALNHHEAIQVLEKMVGDNSRLSSNEIMSIHAVVLQRIEREFAGRYRNAGVRITGANFTPPNALKVDELMNDLIEWVNEVQGIHDVVKAALFHHRMVWIHPFFDGNGRTARLVYNLILMRCGYPPAIVLQQDRKKYYDALNQANDGNLQKFILLILQAVERSLDIYLSCIENKQELFKPIASVVEELALPYGSEYLSLLIRKGKIEGYKEGRNWLTTVEGVQFYHTHRQRKRIVK